LPVQAWRPPAREGAGAVRDEEGMGGGALPPVLEDVEGPDGGIEPRHPKLNAVARRP
jgi:hypothetical protein